MAFSSFFLLLIILIILCYLIKKWANGPLNYIKKDLTGKLIIITGSSDWIGLETAKNLLTSNAKVIFACRNKNKTEAIINKFHDNLKKNSTFIQLDLESFKSIKNCAREIILKYPKIDILINNAGMAANQLNKTEDGYIDTFQVNYLGNVLLTLLLLDHFNEKESKIINVSSMGYKFSKMTYGYSKYLNNYDLMLEFYSKIQSKQNLYFDTKLLLNYFTQYLADLIEEKYPYLKIVCLHPGAILTNIIKINKLFFKILYIVLFKNILYLFTKNITYGAQTTLYLAYSDNKDLVNGGYYANLKVEKYTPKAKDEKLKKEMVNETLKILKEKFKELEGLPFSK